MNSDHKHYWMPGTVLALGAGLRIFFAACYRFQIDSDYGIVGLMARRLMTGADCPAFYYGQAYMGSLEPLLSALCCRLFGFTMFNVCLGTALTGILLLPVVHAWGRDAGGRAGGLAAMACLLIGPIAHIRFLAWPWGGYGVILLLGTLLLWLTSRVALRAWRREPVPAAWYGWLGLLAGLAWWTSPLTVPALITAGTILLGALRLDAFRRWRLPAGLAGFALGSLPWWLWNIRHGWASLAMAGSLDRHRAAAGWSFFIGRRLPDLLDLAGRPPAAVIAGLLLAALLVVFSVSRLVSAWRRAGGPDQSTAALATALLFIPVAATVFCLSHFAAFETSRYLLPLLPAMAVLVGAATAWLTTRLPWWLGWLPLAMLLAFQAWNARYAPALLRDRTWPQTAAVFERELAQTDIEAVFCRYPDHWLNIAVGEKHCFVDILGDRLPDYERRGENARRIALLGNPGDAAAFITNSGGRARGAQVMSSLCHYDLQAPGVDVPLDPAAWSAAEDHAGDDVLAAISDDNALTGWEARLLPGSPAWIEIFFRSPVTVTGVRLLAADGCYPPAWSIAGRADDAGNGGWRELTPMMRIHYFFWSGPRLYWNGTAFRAECRFPPATVSRLRVRCEAPERAAAAQVSELTVFGDAPAAAQPTDEDLAQLAAALTARGIRKLYSDRWEANEIALAAGGRVATVREPSVFERGPGSLPRPRERRLTPMRLDAHTAVLVRAAETPACARVLAGLEMRAAPLGPWTLFDFAPGTAPADADPGLAWAGYTALKNHLPRPAVPRPHGRPVPGRVE